MQYTPTPSVAPASKPLRILHLGLGSFHRAHQAVYLQQLHTLGDTDWTLASGNLRPDQTQTIDTLIAQGGGFTLETVSPQGQRDYLRIQSIQEVVPYHPSAKRLLELAIDPLTRIISFTVTEAGYYLDPQDRLDWNGFPELSADLAKLRQAEVGNTIYGALTAFLRARKNAKAGAVTLLNCDNLRHNGERVRTGLLQFIQALGDQDLYAWVEQNTTCPSSMVDRITPRPTADVAKRVQAATGIQDDAALMAESFIQWVIEDRFAHGRPQWERVGVQMVSSVQAYEEVKIRLLNATHACIAWAGTLAGYQYIHEGMADSRIREIAYRYVSDDTIPVLDAPENPSPIDLPSYRDTVLERFANPAIADTNQRVAMDAFSKIPGQIAPTIRERLERGQSIASVAMLPALFLCFLQRWHNKQLSYAYQDQAMNTDTAHAICAAPNPIAAFAADTVLWGDLANNPALLTALRQAYARVQDFEKHYPHTPTSTKVEVNA